MNDAELENLAEDDLLREYRRLRDAARALLAVYESGEDITGEIPEVVALREVLG